MAVKAPANIEERQPGSICEAAEGCAYLRDLSAIEHIAGFEHTARRYAASAEDCRVHGCRTAATEAADAMDAVVKSVLVTLTSFDVPRRRRFAQASEGWTGAIPFKRSALIDALSDSDGNYVERRRLKLADLPAKGDALGYMYRYWLDLRRAGALQFANIDTVHLTRAGVIGSLHVVDVSSGDPDEFRFDLFGYAVPISRPERPRAYPVRIYADATLRDYNTVRLTRAPLLDRMHCRLGDTMHHYTRLILPFLDEGDRVARLCVAIRQERCNSLKVETGH
jgi:hypothetical protein